MDKQGPHHARRGRVLALVAVLFAATGAAGCLDDQLDPNQTAGSTDTFVPFERDFLPFLGWRRVQVGDQVIVDGHAAGPRFCYINSTPSNGSYPVGTIIVKTVEVGDMSDWTIHARAKRGGGVNFKGALDWEWFELRYFTTGLAIVWGAYEPPADHGYESLPGLGATATNEASCNGCHNGATDRESILAKPLRAELGL
jgi:hypothetical protein